MLCVVGGSGEKAELVVMCSAQDRMDASAQTSDGWGCALPSEWAGPGLSYSQTFQLGLTLILINNKIP